MSAEKDGGPAFPQLQQYRDPIGGAIHTASEGGMTLRDWFAGQALAGNCGYPTNEGTVVAALVSEAYAIADAMLAERDK